MYLDMIIPTQVSAVQSYRDIQWRRPQTAADELPHFSRKHIGRAQPTIRALHFLQASLLCAMPQQISYQVRLNAIQAMLELRRPPKGSASEQ